MVIVTIANFLLSDECEISENDYLERKQLITVFSSMPEEFFSKLRHLQPQVGCLNACKICSKFADCRVEFWSESRLRNIIAALKYSSPQRKSGMCAITYDRKEHRNSVIFPYLDNDVGNYPYLDKFITLLKRELGVTTRISSVSFSRHNEELNDMHKKISQNQSEGLGGVRLSFTPYEIGWECKSEKFSQFDYILDMANFLEIYKPYFEEVGSGSREACVEIRYKPLVKITDVYITEILSHMVICTENYLWISKYKNIQLFESKIKDPYDHNISLTEEPQMFFCINLYLRVKNIEEVKRIAHKFIVGNNMMESYNLSEVYLMRNYDGIYYAINPTITENGNYGINIYPKAGIRTNSGYIITERFFLNELISYKKAKNMKSLDTFLNATWEDVYAVLEHCKKTAYTYKNIGKIEKYEYIINEVLPMINAYISALQQAGYEASLVFDYQFSIDTGIICNLGRAINEFCGLTNKENEPLTPTHERNYGRYNSKMTQEGVAWRLSCDYDDSIVIERLNMFDTASEKGQVSYRTVIKLNAQTDQIYKMSDLRKKYLIPGQRKNE